MVATETKLTAVLSGKSLKGELTLLGQTFTVYLGSAEEDTITEYSFDYVLKKPIKKTVTKHIFTLCEM